MVQWPEWTRFQGTEGDTPKDTTDDSTSGNPSLTQFDTLPIPLLALTAFAVGSATTLTGVFIYTRYCRRLKNSDWVTPNVLRKRRWIKGVVTGVGDADNFRLYHTPPLGGWHWPLKIRKIPSLRKDLRNETIHIRIAGVDAPEAGHFGKPTQPFAAESLMWLKGRILGKVVYCQLLRRDQYSRIVAYVQMSPKVLPGLIASGKSLPLEMLKAGWVTTYEQAGAEYGKYGRDAYLCAEAEAKAARRGMWKHGTQLETPAEYKRRQAQRLIEGNAETIMTKGNATTTTNVTWWNRLQKSLWS